MLLRITSTHSPASDLGFLLHKHPDRLQSFKLPFGKAHVFYPESTAERCEFAMLLDVDPVGLARGGRNRPRGGIDLTHYVNDRPYVTSSFMSVAIARVLTSALAGRSTERPELVKTAIPLEASMTALPSRRGKGLVQDLFEPLGYEVEEERLPLDPTFPAWGESSFRNVRLTGVHRLQDLLRHLYVLTPVLDDYKHYWVSQDEIEKLLSKGEGWLESHPAKDLIARRYLRHQRSLTAQALARLVVEEVPDIDAANDDESNGELEIERPLRLHERRLDAVVDVLSEEGSTNVLDLGCGEGKLVSKILKTRGIDRITGVDVSIRALEVATRRLKLDRLPPSVRERVSLLHGSVLYRDQRFLGHDAIVAVEVIEHLDAARLKAFVDVVFRHARPKLVVLTTPNREYNALFPSLPAGQVRHRDHRFEWTRAEFREWTSDLEDLGYFCVHTPLGDVDPDLGGPSQMGVLKRHD